MKMRYEVQVFRSETKLKTRHLEHSYQTPYFFFGQFGFKKPTFASLAKAPLYHTPYSNFTILFFNIFLLFYLFFHNFQNTNFSHFFLSSFYTPVAYSPLFFFFFFLFSFPFFSSTHVYLGVGSGRAGRVLGKSVVRPQKINSRIIRPLTVR